MKKTLLLNVKSDYDDLSVRVKNIKVDNYNSKSSSGSFITESENVDSGLFIYNVKDAKNVILQSSDVGAFRLCDSILGGSGETYDLYATIGSGLCNNIYCSIQCGTCVKMYYSMFCESCSFCLGCIGLKNKSYCIFNKQYSKEERYEKVDEIFAQMDEDGTLGEFFPATMNPFYFNDTAAYLIMGSEGTEPRSTAGQAFTKEEVIAKGYLRRDEPIKVDIPAGVQTVKNTELDQFEGRRDEQRRISDEILKKVIIDEQGNAYRIIPMELEFLRKYGLPLPRKHRLERMKENFRIG